MKTIKTFLENVILNKENGAVIYNNEIIGYVNKLGNVWSCKGNGCFKTRKAACTFLLEQVKTKNMKFTNSARLLKSAVNDDFVKIIDRDCVLHVAVEANARNFVELLSHMRFGDEKKIIQWCIQENDLRSLLFYAKNMVAMKDVSGPVQDIKSFIAVGFAAECLVNQIEPLFSV